MTQERLKEIQLKAEQVERDNPDNRIAKDLLELINEVKQNRPINFTSRSELKRIVMQDPLRGASNIYSLKEENKYLIELLRDAWQALTFGTNPREKVLELIDKINIVLEKAQ